MPDTKNDGTNTPRVTEDVLQDDDRLADVIDEVVTRDRDIMRMARKIILRQRDLRLLIDPEAFEVFLDIQVATHDRWNLVISKVTKWAFDQGQRSRTEQ